MSTTKTTRSHEEAERLAAQAAEAVARAEDARARAEEAARKAEEERQAAIFSIRRRRLEEYDEAALLAQERDAQATFAKAVLTDEGAVGAYVDWQVAVSWRYLLAVEARQAQQQVNPDASPLAVGGPPGQRYVDEVQRVIDRAVANRVEDLRDELQAELDAAGR